MIEPLLNMLPAPMRRALSDYFPFVPSPPAQFVTEDGRPVYGMMAEFKEAPAIYEAAKAVRDAGYTQWDVHTPMPVHGLDEAMGVKRTILPLIVAFVGFTGVGLAVLFQWWVTAVEYPLVVQGKPYEAWEPWTPITFEIGVLFSAFACLVGMLSLNGLPRFNHPLFKKSRFLKTSDDTFVICIEAGDPKFQPEQTRGLLESVGGAHIDLVEDD